MTRFNVGDIITVHTKDMKGIDGNKYNVLTFMAAGRGWCERQSYHYETPVEFEVEVVKINNDGEFYGKVTDKKYVDSLGAPKRFSKRPYVRKDGSYIILRNDCLVDHLESILGAYGAFEFNNEGERLYSGFNDTLIFKERDNRYK